MVDSKTSLLLSSSYAQLKCIRSTQRAKLSYFWPQMLQGCRRCPKEYEQLHFFSFLRREVFFYPDTRLYLWRCLGSSATRLFSHSENCSVDLMTGYLVLNVSCISFSKELHLNPKGTEQSWKFTRLPSSWEFFSNSEILVISFCLFLNKLSN